MKCIHCQNDCRHSERLLGYCPSCKHPFAFEPQSGDKVTDMAFQKALERVSAGGKVRWTLDHLFQELRRPKASLYRPARWLSGALLVLSAGLFAADNAGPGLAAGIVGALIGLTALINAPGKSPTREEFQKYWERWLKVHGGPAGLVEAPKSRPRPNPALEAELSAYSFDRVVVCDRRAIVDVLLANQFHFENNCAVVSVDGYPEGTFPIVMKMLRQNPKLNVLVVHDASVPGCRLAHMLRKSPDWFAGVGRVIDVGLRPAHDRFFPGMAQANNPPIQVEAKGDITASEAQWLSRWRLELTVVRPEQLIKRLYRAMTSVESEDREEGFDADFDVILFGEDADTSDGGGDSFG